MCVICVSYVCHMCVVCVLGGRVCNLLMDFCVVLVLVVVASVTGFLFLVPAPRKNVFFLCARPYTIGRLTEE